MVGRSRNQQKRSGNFSWSKCHVNLWKLVYQCTLSCQENQDRNRMKSESMLIFFKCGLLYRYIILVFSLYRYTIYCIYYIPPITSHIAVSMFWLSVGTPYLPPTDRWHQLPGASPTHRYSLGTLDPNNFIISWVYWGDLEMESKFGAWKTQLRIGPGLFFGLPGLPNHFPHEEVVVTL